MHGQTGAVDAPGWLQYHDTATVEVEGLVTCCLSIGAVHGKTGEVGAGVVAVPLPPPLPPLT